jgi:peptide-methionine (S)-S-oxide reductase
MTFKRIPAGGPPARKSGHVVVCGTQSGAASGSFGARPAPCRLAQRCNGTSRAHELARDALFAQLSRRKTMNRIRLRLVMLLLYLLTAVAAFAPAAYGQAKPSPGTAIATFAGGCFWCMEPPYDEIPGVVSTTSGYIGGHKKNPTYEEVSRGSTGHTEAVQIVYDPKKVTYDKLLEIFWRNIDPTTPNAQFCDHGSQYRSGVFYHDEEQRRLAVASRDRIERTKPFREPIVTEITAATVFYPAEDYHQDYYKKNPLRYKFYRANCGRDSRLEQLWGKPAR